MTLSRKILLRNLMLLLGVLLLGTVSLAGLWRLRGQVGVALDEYSELRLLQQVALSAATARGALLAEEPDASGARQELASAATSLASYLQFQEQGQEGSESHERAEEQVAGRALLRLRQTMAQLDEGPPPPALRQEIAAGIQQVLGQIGRLTKDADALIARTERRATSSVREAAIAVTIILFVIISAAAIIGTLQHRGIVGPLANLRHGVRRIARGNFSQRLPTDGDLEFAELAEDFNRMAADLDGLYHGLEEKVAVKSRELVRSERLASVGFLAAGVAHEINNPLHIISGYAELSLKRLGNAGSAVELRLRDAGQSLQIIRDETFRCKRIIDKLLSLSRPGNDQHAAVSLRDIAHEVADMVRAHKVYRGRELLLDFHAAEPLLTRGSESELKQVLLNLAVNALEAIESMPGQVRFEGSRNNGWVELRVTDNGCGMSPDIKERIFEPFFTNRSGGQRGLGLGLSISHAIIESHGGAILAESDGPGRGSRFTLRLPALAENGDAP